MNLCGALCMLLTLSMACGLRCYSCVTSDPEYCTDTVSCSIIYNRCYSLTIGGIAGINLATKGCQSSIACVGNIFCCEGDLCNSAGTAGPSIILLLASSVIISLFL